MRLVRAALMVWVALGVGRPCLLLAQGIDRSFERVSAARQGQSQLRLSTPSWTEPRPRNIGVFTLVPTTNPGEIVRLGLPIGALVSRTAQRFARANQRRREESARLEVVAALTARAARRR